VQKTGIHAFYGYIKGVRPRGLRLFESGLGHKVEQASVLEFE
jgi:hypothetical protein